MIYWVDGSQVHSNDATKNDGGGNATVASTDAGLSAFTVTGNTTYFADKSDVGQIFKSNVAPNSTPQLIARKQVGVTSIAGDATHAYWANGDCSIMSLGL